MEKGEYTGTAVPGYSTYRITSLLVLSEALTSFLVFLDFPDHLPAPKMFKLQYFLIFFFFFPFWVVSSWCSCEFFFLFSTQCSFFGGRSSAGGGQLRSCTGDLQRGQFAPARKSSPVHYWFVPGHDLTLHFCMFSSPFTVSSPCLSDHGTHKNHFNHRPTSSHLSGSLV